MAKRKADVRQEGETYWFSLPLAAGLAGLTQAEMMRRANAGELITDPKVTDDYWFEREEIWALKKAREVRSAEWRQRNPNGAKKRGKTPEQQEKEWARQSEDLKKRQRQGGGGVSAHYEKILLSEVAAAERKRKSK